MSNYIIKKLGKYKPYNIGGRILSPKIILCVRGDIMAEKSAIDWIALILVIVGGLNWGLVGLFDFNLVSAIFGSVTWLMNLVYILVGVSALWMLKFLKK